MLGKEKGEWGMGIHLVIYKTTGGRKLRQKLGNGLPPDRMFLGKKRNGGGPFETFYSESQGDPRGGLFRELKTRPIGQS